MFGFLKKKVEEFSASVKKAFEAEPEPAKKVEEKPAFVKPHEAVKEKPREAEKPAREAKPKEVETPKHEEAEKPAHEKKGLGERIFGAAKKLIEEKAVDEKAIEPLLEEFELALMQANVASEVARKIVVGVKEKLVGRSVKRGKEKETIESAVREALAEVMIEGEFKAKDGDTVMFVGINGTGKTTTMAKIANLLQKQGHKVVFAAADTFRAAAIEQLEKHAHNLGIKVVKHDYGADAAAVVFDAVKHSQSKGGIVLVDTAGRMQSNKNLMEELRKIKRVNKITTTIFVGDSLTGNDAVEQARTFNEEIGIDGIVLCKTDIDEKGGAAISVSEVTGKPIFFLATGQGYDDIAPFRKGEILAKLGFQ